MFDLIDIFDIYQHKKLGELGTLQSDSDRRITSSGDRLRDLEQRYERLHLVTIALWELLKNHTGLTDADLKRYIEKVDLSDGTQDGKLSRRKGAVDCPQCSRRVLKSATTCAWCGVKLDAGNPFEAT